MDAYIGSMLESVVKGYLICVFSEIDRHEDINI